MWFLNYLSTIYSLDPNCFWCVKLKRCQFIAIRLQSLNSLSVSVTEFVRFLFFLLLFSHRIPTANDVVAWFSFTECSQLLNFRLFFLPKSSLCFLLCHNIYWLCHYQRPSHSHHLCCGGLSFTSGFLGNSLIISHCSRRHVCHLNSLEWKHFGFEDPCNSMSIPQSSSRWIHVVFFLLFFFRLKT